MFVIYFILKINVSCIYFLYSVHLGKLRTSLDFYLLLLFIFREIEVLEITLMVFQILITPNILFEKTSKTGCSGCVTMLASKISVLILQEGTFI